MGAPQAAPHTWFAKNIQDPMIGLGSSPFSDKELEGMLPGSPATKLRKATRAEEEAQGKADIEKARSLLAPDMADKTLMEARKNQMAAMLSGRGRRSTFLTGSLGDVSYGAPRSTLLGGGQ